MAAINLTCLVCRVLWCCVSHRQGDLLFDNLYDYSDFGCVKRAVKWEINVCLQLVTVAREVP